MKVLAITGDRSFAPGYPRFDLQRAAVNELSVVYWWRGSLWPKIPLGKFDVVTAQDPLCRGLFGWLTARRIGAKFNVQVHTDLSARNFFWRVLARAILRNADSIRVVSEKIKNQVLSMGTRAPVHVLPIYVDVSRFRNIKRQPHTQKTILWFGRFEPEKDPLLAIKILEQIRRTIAAKLIMLGAGSLEKSLKTNAARLNLAAQVEFPGWREPLPYLAQADMVLCTSRHESYGASVIEALAAGVPVVAPDVGIAKSAGAVVAPREKLADAVIEVLRSKKIGELKVPLLDKEAWIQKWRDTL